MDYQDLTLQEQLLLLALDDESGQFHASYLNYALNAGGLIELSDKGAVAVASPLVRVVSTQPTGVDALDLALSHLAADPSDLELKHLIRVLYRQPATIQEILCARLVLRGILREEEGRFLWVFSQLTHPTADPTVEGRMRQALRELLIGQTAPSPALARLAALVNVCGLLESVLTDEEIRQFQLSIERARSADPLGDVVSKAVLDVVMEDRQAASTGLVIAGIAAAGV